MEIKIFDTKKEGQHIVFFGAVHGNESCGTVALKQLIQDLKQNPFFLERGKVTIVPVCNEAAFEKNVRFIDQDLNRVFKKTEHPQTNEEHVANELTALIDDCDVFLDIHSTESPGEPSVFVDFPTAENKAFSGALGMPHAILGWPSLYEQSTLESFDTTAYAHSKGKTGLLIECGQHTDLKSAQVAHNAIYRTLSYFGLIPIRPINTAPPQEITMTHLFIREGVEDKLAYNWQHLQEIGQGEVIAIRETGEKIIAERDVVMILPKANKPVGTEWFYLGSYL